MRRRRLLWNLYAALFLTVLFLAAMLLGTWLRVRRTAPPAPLAYVAFLDVGDGDCALIRAVDGRTILVDTGSAKAGPQVVRILKSLHVLKIDLLVLASPDERSVGGVPAVLAAFPVSEAWNNSVADGGAAQLAALEAIRRQHIYGQVVVHAGKKLQIGDATFWSVLWPPEHGPRARRDSLICQMDFGATRFVFAGAASGEGAGALVAEADAPGCDTRCSDLVLQIPEGGAAAGVPPEILRRIAPSVAVISCSAQTPPAPLALHRLQAAGAEVHETDTMGTIIVAADGRSAPTITAFRF